MDKVLEILDDNDPVPREWVPQEWLNCGQKYKDVPPYVALALSKQYLISAHFVSVQLFEHQRRRSFKVIHALGMIRFTHLIPNAFLVSIPSNTVRSVGVNQMEVNGESGRILDELLTHKEQLVAAAAILNSRSKKNTAAKDVEEDL
jgi:hypothetical protein